MTFDEIDAWLQENFPDQEFLLADGFESAFCGVVYGKMRTPVACYDRERCIEILVSREGLTEDDAEEFFSYNVEDAWVGETTPVFLTGYSVEVPLSGPGHRAKA